MILLTVDILANCETSSSSCWYKGDVILRCSFGTQPFFSPLVSSCEEIITKYSAKAFGTYELTTNSLSYLVSVLAVQNMLSWKS